MKQGRGIDSCLRGAFKPEEFSWGSLAFTSAAMLGDMCIWLRLVDNAENAEDVIFAGPNVRAKRATAAGRQAREDDDKQHGLAGLVACRWRSA